MALGFGSKKSEEDRSAYNNSNEKGYDAENGGRIEAPARRDLNDRDGYDVDVGKQIEMEADNAIQYRTCSWPKVSSFYSLIG